MEPRWYLRKRVVRYAFSRKSAEKAYEYFTHRGGIDVYTIISNYKHTMKMNHRAPIIVGVINA